MGGVSGGGGVLSCCVLKAWAVEAFGESDGAGSRRRGGGKDGGCWYFCCAAEQGTRHVCAHPRIGGDGLCEVECGFFEGRESVVDETVEDDWAMISAVGGRRESGGRGAVHNSTL